MDGIYPLTILWGVQCLMNGLGIAQSAYPFCNLLAILWMFLGLGLKCFDKDPGDVFRLEPAIDEIIFASTEVALIVYYISGCDVERKTSARG